MSAAEVAEVDPFQPAVTPQAGQEPGHDADDVVSEVAGNAQSVQGRVQMSGGAVEMGVTDAQASVGPGEVGSAIALATAQRLAQDRGDITAVREGDAIGEEGPERRVSQQPLEEPVDGSDQGGPAADGLVDADRLRFVGGCRVGCSWS